MIDIEHLRRSRQSRRQFLTRMGAAGLGVAAAALLDSPGQSRFVQADTTFPEDPTLSTDFPGIPGLDTDNVVLNYALTLEFLEADLYRQALNAAAGLALDTPLANGPDNYTLAVAAGGLSDGNTGAGFNYLADFAFVERAHADFLTLILSASGLIAVTANNAGYSFPGGPGATLSDILSQILPLEETGTRAYLGALPFITSLDVAQTAGGIFSTECRHSAAVNLVLGNDPGPGKKTGDLMVLPSYPANNALEYYLAPATVISAVGAYFNS